MLAHAAIPADDHGQAPSNPKLERTSENEAPAVETSAHHGAGLMNNHLYDSTLSPHFYGPSSVIRVRLVRRRVLHFRSCAPALDWRAPGRGRQAGIAA